MLDMPALRFFDFAYRRRYVGLKSGLWKASISLEEIAAITISPQATIFGPFHGSIAHE
jgi:hypothetical protein